LIVVLIIALANGAVLSTKGQTFSTAGGSLAWSNSVNWTPATVPNGVGTSDTFNTISNTTASLTNISPTVGSIVINLSSGSQTSAHTPSGGGPLKSDETGSGPAPTTTSGNGTGNTPISTPMALNDSLTATVNQTTSSSPAGSLNLTTAMSGSGGFTKLCDGL